MTDAIDDTLVLIATLQVRPDRRDAFLAYTTANLPVSRAADGNIQFDMLLDPAQPHTVRFFEIWRSTAAQQAYMAWRIAQGDLTTLSAFLSAEPAFLTLRRVAA